MKKIRVLIVDDSAVVRQSLEKVLNSQRDIEVIGTAADPLLAAKRIEQNVPDVITLDVEMPRMDGITFLQKIMSQHPIPVVICSTLTEKGAETTLKALEYGATDIILKPKLGTKQFFEESKIKICDAVRAAAKVRVKKISSAKPLRSRKKLTADVMIAAPTGRAMAQTTERIIAVGASTGGTEALRVFLEALPQDAPGIVIVQHMPEGFTKAFAERINGLCRIRVKEAENNDTILRGQALIAPGNKHTLVKRSGARYYVEVKDGPMVSRHRPSVDVLFRSTARYAGKNATGVILTGMGDDGAKGMLEMRQAGSYNIGQDEKSCIVYGMPKEAFKLGAVNIQIPLENIASAVLKNR